MTMDEIVRRCSNFSGYNLSWNIKESPQGKLLTIEDPAHLGPSTLTIRKYRGFDLLHEVYGRMRHWSITLAEEQVIIEMLKD